MRNPNALVIGGAGFLGKRIVKGLLELSGESEQMSRYEHVRCFDLRRWSKEVEEVEERMGKLSFIVGDLMDTAALTKALDGIDVVFHTATPPPSCNDKDLFHKVNVIGTQHVIQCCLDAGVKCLVLTSSASVLYSGEDLKNADETTDYAHNPMDHYASSKIMQEKIVLESNSSQLLTVAIRPHGIFGPGDPLCIPTILQNGRRGKLRFMIGDGANIVDFTHVTNVVHGHLLAAEKLLQQASLPAAQRGTLHDRVDGEAFLITNDEPIPFWAFLSAVLQVAAKADDVETPAGEEGAGVTPAKFPHYHLPYTLIASLAKLVDQGIALVNGISPVRVPAITFSPSRVALAGTHHYYSCEKAKQRLGYKPIVPLMQGLEGTVPLYLK